jgi:hypothetical protein
MAILLPIRVPVAHAKAFRTNGMSPHLAIYLTSGWSAVGQNFTFRPLNERRHLSVEADQTLSSASCHEETFTTVLKPEAFFAGVGPLDCALPHTAKFPGDQTRSSANRASNNFRAQATFLALGRHSVPLTILKQQSVEGDIYPRTKIS